MRQFRIGMALCAAATLCLSTAGVTHAADWLRFRGPNGSGTGSGEAQAPIEWSSTKNLKWKVDLPGPGASSPIIVGNRILLTCWTGYADGGNGGSLENLKRHLLCYDRVTGTRLWDAEVPAVLPEDRFEGMFAENGYATHTPVSDGEKVYVFYGKSGVYAYDLDGRQLWYVSAGTGLDRRNWGSASSPILYRNLVIVTASAESHALIAFDKDSGEQVWKQEAEGLGSTWGTPVLVKVDDERTDLVLAVPYEIWGLDPTSGKLKWYCEAIASSSMCSSVVADGNVVYAVESGPDGGGAVAVKAGGSGDVTKTHVLWSGRERSRVGTPVIHDGRMHWISGGTATALDAKTGDQLYQVRLQGGDAAGSRESGSGRPGFGGGFGGGRGGRGGGQDYSSPVVSGGHMYYLRRSGDMYIVKLGKEFEQVAVNRFDDGGDFNATPALGDGEIFIRSSRHLYCVAAE